MNTVLERPGYVASMISKVFTGLVAVIILASLIYP
jgi:hypothetical protein